jgi:HTH-type transcriptional regulator/antitoxin HigA
MKFEESESNCFEVPVPPGETIADLLEEQEMTQAALAARLGVSTKHLNQVVKGSASISAELALGLEKVFSVGADFWLTRESIYRSQLARQAERESLKQSIGWAKQFPVKELKARGYLPADAKDEGLVAALLQFLGLASVEQWHQPVVSYRKSQKVESDGFALAAWLRIGELRAREIECEPFDAERFRDALERARGLTALEPEEWAEQLVEMCASCGVAVVILEHFQLSRVNGATRWLSPHKALIQLSLRQNWEDIFWFTFFHEAGHVLLHRKKLLLVEPVRPSSEAEMDPDLFRLEKEADKFAAQMLIPPRYERRLKDIGFGDIPTLAEEIGVAPAIVVGRLQHDGILKYNQGNKMRRRYEFRETASH